MLLLFSRIKTLFIIASPLSSKLTNGQFFIDSYYLTTTLSNLICAYAKEVLTLVSYCPNVSSFFCQLWI